jgi:hypothetical protein
MKRAFAVLAGFCLVLIIGCGNYDSRLDQTLQEMRYRKRLNDNLVEAPTKGKLQDLAIFVRPPKALKGPTKTFTMTVVEPGKFDVENSFIDEAKQESMHILARVVRPKATPKKGAPQPEPTPRGKFIDDVLELVKTVYGVELEPSQFKADSHSHGNRTNTFKAKTVDLTAKKVQIFFYGDEKAKYQVALIFEYPEGSHASINPKIPLCLESFAVDDVARRAFAGSGEEFGGEEGGPGQPPPI